jgi:hypothetical protein
MDAKYGHYLFFTGLSSYFIGILAEKKYPKFATGCYVLSIPIQVTSMYFNIKYLSETKERIKKLEKQLEASE